MMRNKDQTGQGRAGGGQRLGVGRRCGDEGGRNGFEARPQRSNGRRDDMVAAADE